MSGNTFAEKFKNLFAGKKSVSDEFYDDLADALVEGDVSARDAVFFIDELQKACREEKIFDEEGIRLRLKKILLEHVVQGQIGIVPEKTNVFMLLGVNGVGKTTACAKMAKIYEKEGLNVVMAAADTFRAAAVDQIALHGERLGIRVIKHQMGSDPSAVVFDACDSISASGGGIVLADTSGRLHNKENLMNELKKIDRICASKSSEGCYKKILVIDSTTGQNALRQAEVFHEAVGIDSVILTKYDSTAKGGVLISMGKSLGIPVSYVCFGEKYDDIALFDAEKYVDEFLGID